MRQAHLFISGIVQGVGYRYFVRSQAQKSGIRGFVQNLPDGRVEIVLQGSKQAIEKLITLCQTGPEVSQVQEVWTKWENVTTRLDEFEII